MPLLILAFSIVLLLVLFIIAGGGAFRQVLLDSGTGTAIEQFAKSLTCSPLEIGFVSHN